MSSVSVETSGTYDVEKFRVSAGVPHDPNLSFIVDWKLSSAKAKPNQPLSMYVKLRERDRIKFVVSSEADFNEAVEAARAIRARNRRTPIYFSPSFNALAPALLMEWMRRAGVQVDDIRLNLQIHKIIWPGDSRVEEDEGVDFTKRSLGREQFIERARTPDEKL
jgi:7-carboxy-7-deazaguanine synthase